MNARLLLQPVSVESVMSRYRPSTLFSGYAQAQRQEPIIEPKPVELTPGQQIALLTLRGSQLAKAVLQKLAHSTARASYFDYRDLVHLRFAEPRPKAYGHQITFYGRVHANILAHNLAIELGINPHQYDVARPRKLYNPGINSIYNPW